MAGLKAGAQAMTAQDKQTISRPVLSSTAAQLFISDMKISCEFFTAKLGFSIEFLYGDPPYYGEVSRNNALLGLRLVCEPAFVADIREREQLLSAAITVDTAAEIKQLFLDFQAAEVKFYQTLKKQPWGARNFIVLDPHGNLILFAGPGD
jgi:catechol 2,3-dioxygenase-like lactoylglutathione lyase family enzyme